MDKFYNNIDTMSAFVNGLPLWVKFDDGEERRVTSSDDLIELLYRNEHDYFFVLD